MASTTKMRTDKEIIAEAKPIDLLETMERINTGALINCRRDIKRLMKEKVLIANLIKVQKKYGKKIPL